MLNPLEHAQEMKLFNNWKMCYYLQQADIFCELKITVFSVLKIIKLQLRQDHYFQCADDNNTFSGCLRVAHLKYVKKI